MTAFGLKWKVVPFGSLAEFKNGVNYTKANFGKGIKIINVKDFQDYSLAKFDKLDEINPQGIVRDKDLLQEHDILFVRSNGNRELIGRTLYVAGLSQPVTHSAFTIRARFIAEGILPRFYAYLLRSDLVRQSLSASGGGTNISNLNQQILDQLPVTLPPKQTQCRIVAILSAYDDLIENNLQRIKILDEMAQNLYTEWFVNFRFPGHHHARFTDSPLGKIPQGWEVMNVSELLTLEYGKSLTKNKRRPGPYPVVGSSGISGFHDGRLVEGPGIVVGRAGAAGDVHWIDEDFFPIDSAFFVKKKDASLGLHYIYFVLRGLDLKRLVSGAAVPGINRNAVYAEKIVLPDGELMSSFEEHCCVMFDLPKALRTRTDILRRTRDILLPRLISGKVDVSDLDIKAEDGE